MPGNKPITRPIKSQKQRRFFYAEMEKPANERKTDMSYAELAAHIKDVETKHLPATAGGKRRTK
jgi:prephenate dehydratase